MPPDVVYVGRPTIWGNPFTVGEDGTAAECVELYKKLLAGYICVTRKATIEAQRTRLQHVAENLHELRGKSLACWCRPGAPCHADVLLRIANA